MKPQREVTAHGCGGGGGAAEGGGVGNPGPSCARRSPTCALTRPLCSSPRACAQGGGHNFFGDELSAALRTLSREQRSAYILMQRILPRRTPAVLVRDGQVTVGPALSELGVYSTLLTSKSGAILRNAAAGHLVRTKLDGVDEGGVAAGFAVLSSPLAAAAPAKRRSWL